MLRGQWGPSRGSKGSSGTSSGSENIPEWCQVQSQVVAGEGGPLAAGPGAAAPPAAALGVAAASREAKR